MMKNSEVVFLDYMRRLTAAWPSPPVLIECPSCGGLALVPSNVGYESSRCGFCRGQAVGVGVDDMRRLDFLAAFGEKWICRDSVMGRGIRVHQTSAEGSFDTPREAIDAYRASMEGETEDSTQEG